MKPLRVLGNIATAALAIVIAVQFARVAAQWSVIDFIDGVKPGIAVDTERARQVDANVQAVAAVHLLAFAVATVAFLAWFHRAAANLRDAGLKHMEFGPGWAIGGFFVPFLNLVRPAQVMKEVWAGTTFLAGRARVSSWKRAPGTQAIGWWWGLYLLGIVAAMVGMIVISGGRNDLGTLKAGCWICLASYLVEVVSGLALVHLVRQVTDMQDAAAARLGDVTGETFVEPEAAPI
jgi:hypothetical protein